MERTGGTRERGRKAAREWAVAHDQGAEHDADAVRRSAIVRAACAAARCLQEPRPGVLVVRQGQRVLSAAPDPQVPEGVIHYRLAPVRTP